MPDAPDSLPDSSDSTKGAKLAESAQSAKSAQSAQSPPPSAPGGRARWIALLVAGAFFMENLDGTVIATALPQMAQSFGRQPVDLNIGMSAYLLTLAVLIPISGWVADRFGARTIFSAATALFTFASVMCGLSNSLDMFIAMRILQGVGGAMMVPVGRLVVLNNTPKAALMSAIATITWPGLVAPILGPPLGGAITSYASWRWIFYLNLPLGIVAFAVALWLIPNRRTEQTRRFDWLGFVASGGGLLSLMYGIELVGRQTVVWAEAAACMGLGLLLIAGAARHFHRSAAPMIDLASLKVPTFAVTIWGGSLFRIAIGAVPFLLPLMFQLGFGLDAFHAGLLVLAVFAGNLAMKPGTSAILKRFGFKRVLIVNGLANALTLLACAALSPDTPVAVILIVLFVGGLCRSMQFTALNTIAFADVPQPHMSGANTLFSTAMQLSMGMGIAVGAVALRASGALDAWMHGRTNAALHGMHGTGIDATLPGAAHVPLIDFHLAFLLISLLAFAAVIDCLKLKPEAGQHVAAPSRRR